MESYHHKPICKMWQKPSPYVHLHQHQSHQHWHQAHQPGVGFIPQHSPLTKGGPWVFTCHGWLLQENTMAFLISLANFTLFQGVVLFLASLLPGSLTPSAVRPSCHPCQITLGHELPLLSGYSLNFPSTRQGTTPNPLMKKPFGKSKIEILQNIYHLTIK